MRRTFKTNRTLTTSLVQMPGSLLRQLYILLHVIQYMYAMRNLPIHRIRRRFREFFRNYQVRSEFIYRDRLIHQWGRHEHFIEVDLAHLNEFDEILYNSLQVMTWM